MVTLFVNSIFLLATACRLQSAQAKMTCTEIPPLNVYDPTGVRCVLPGSGRHIFNSDQFAIPTAENFREVFIVTEGHLTMPSRAFQKLRGRSLGTLDIQAKMGVTLAVDAFTGFKMLGLSLNFEQHSLSNAASSGEATFDGLNVQNLFIGGFKKLDFSGIQRIGQLYYTGSSEGQTIVWPPTDKLDGIYVLEMKTDQFLPHFGVLKKLKRLTINSLVSPEPVQHLMDSLAQMEFSELDVLELDNCFTPDVINLPFNQMPSLMRLDLKYNNITALPSSPSKAIGRNENLQYVDLSNNQISEIPAKFFNFAAESEFFSHGVHMLNNPVRTIGENAFANVVGVDISLADSVSLKAFDGVYSRLTIHIKGANDINGVREGQVARKRRETKIVCDGDAQFCSTICPSITKQVCDTTKEGGVEIDARLCNGKFENHCKV